MAEPIETVDLVGVRANGEHVNLGKVAMPPRMKAREIAQSYFGPFQDDDGSEAESCFGAMDELIGWLVKQGWTPPQPTQAQAGAVPLTPEQVAEIADAAHREYDRLVASGQCVPRWSAVFAYLLKMHHGIGIKGGQHGADT